MAQPLVATKPGFFGRNSDIFMGIGIVSVLLLMIVPLSAPILDFLLVISITLSLTILLIGIYVTKPLDFSVFPTILLLSTIYRLALNLASSRLILLKGSEGTDAAGHVIEAFGQFVVGGNQIVGLVIFLILNIINFVVITKGAGRISEVSARFTLDAMPGKQLAIDADLNAGIINDIQARQRREEIQTEADFYGSMDGASKFVKGDAIAGILITFINICGGFMIGVWQGGMTMFEAFTVYTIMTIGDGLVTQIPALIVSFAAGLVVTKVNKQTNLQTQLTAQFLTAYRPLMTVSGLLMVMMFVPGLPKVPFLLVASIVGYTAYWIFQRNKKDDIEKALSPQTQAQDDGADKAAQQDIPQVLDVLEIEVGYDLVDLVNKKKSNDFVKRILAVRKQFVQDMGILVPPIHIQDNLQLKGSEYQILFKSVPVGKGELLPGHLLAMESGRMIRTVDGIPTREPTYGLPAIWITENKKEDAIVAGYTVVDLGSVLATHLSEVIRKSSYQIFNRQDLQVLLDEFKKTYPKVVADLIPELLPFGTVLKVMQNMLREKVPIRDLLTILETLAQEAPKTQDVTVLTERVRQSLGALIANMHCNYSGKIRAITIDKMLEDKLIGSIQLTGGGAELHVDPVTTQKFIEAAGRKISEHAGADGFPVILCSQTVRPHLFFLLEKFVPSVVVLSHNEVAGHTEVDVVDAISGSDKK